MTDPVWSWKGQRPLSGWRSIFSGRVPWMRIDWPILIIAIAMVTTGVVFIQTMSESDLDYGREDVSFPSHVKKLVVALPMFFVGFFLRPRWLRRNAWLVYGVCMILLVLVPVIGEERNSARRWIAMPLGFDLQPSELAKLGLILALGRAMYRSRLRTFDEWLLPGLLALLPMALVAAQPDLGTALTVVPISFGMAWLAGASGRVLSGLLVVGVVVAGLAYQLEWIEGYQRKRIETWAATYDSATLIENKNGPAFHAHKARTSIGNGGAFGTGLGQGVANQAAHLPERESDSIFAVIAEEGGFVGATALVFFYLLMSALLLQAAGRVRERFSRMVVGGVGLYFGAHFLINAGVNLGLLPMTGLTLPLVSTGGSSLLMSFLALGVALGLVARPERSLDADAFRG